MHIKYICFTAPIVAELWNKLISENSDIYKEEIYISNTVLLLKIDSLIYTGLVNKNSHLF